HQPELDRERLAVLAGHAEPERACRSLLFGQSAEESEGAFLGLPARPVDLLIGCPGAGIETVENLDLEAGRLRLALRGAAQLAGALRPISREITAVGGGAPVSGLLRQPHRPAARAEGGGQRFGILDRR